MKKLLAMLLALMMVLSVMAVAVFAEAPETQEDDVEGGDDMNVSDTVDEPKEDENPKTGLALAALPVVFSAAAVAVSKKH